MDEVQKRNRQLLDHVRIRRDALYEALLSLERALAAPARGDPPAWAARLEEPAERLRTVLETHVSGTEGEGGLFQQIRDDEPRLIPAIERLRSEHEPLRTAAAALMERLTSVRTAAEVDVVRTDAADLIHRLIVHRHRGVELVYDAYSVDVSTGD